MELKVYIHDIFEGEVITQSQIKAFCDLTEYLLKVNVKIYYMCVKNFYKIYEQITSTDNALRKRFIEILSNKKGELFEICTQEDNLNCEDGNLSSYFFDIEENLPIKKKSSIGEFISKKIVDDANHYCFILIFQNSIYNSAVSKKIYECHKEVSQISFVKDLQEIESRCAYIYPKNAQTKPTVNQTILRDKNSIKGMYFKYEDYIICKDTLHIGESAHLEVYNLAGEPLGTTLIHKFELIKFSPQELAKRKTITL